MAERQNFVPANVWQALVTGNLVLGNLAPGYLVPPPKAAVQGGTRSRQFAGSHIYMHRFFWQSTYHYILILCIRKTASFGLRELTSGVICGRLRIAKCGERIKVITQLRATSWATLWKGLRA